MQCSHADGFCKASEFQKSISLGWTIQSDGLDYFNYENEIKYKSKFKSESFPNAMGFGT